MPLTCNYYVTLRCNQRCVFCNIPHTNKGSPSREPTMDNVRANLRDLRRLGVRIVDVTGGEPLLYRNIVEMLAYAKRVGLMTTVTTNGMLYPRLASQLTGKLDALLFSLDSTDAAEHDRIRGDIKSFHLVLQALKTARKCGQALYISHVVTNQSYDKIDDMIRFAKEQGAILYLNPCFSFFGNEGLAPEKALGLMRYFGSPNVILDRAQLKLIASGGNDPEAPVCRAVTSTVVISPENELWLPCYHFRKHGLPINNRLFDLYRNAPVVQAAKLLEGRYDFCEGCTVYCYMRSSLFWKYPIDSALLGAHYVRERVMQRVRRTAAPWLPAATTTPPRPSASDAAARRRLPTVH